MDDEMREDKLDVVIVYSLHDVNGYDAAVWGRKICLVRVFQNGKMASPYIIQR